jgi:hypothetical protein
LGIQHFSFLDFGFSFPFQKCRQIQTLDLSTDFQIQDSNLPDYTAVTKNSKVFTAENHKGFFHTPHYRSSLAGSHSAHWYPSITQAHGEADHHFTGEKKCRGEAWRQTALVTTTKAMLTVDLAYDTCSASHQP